MVRRRDFRTKRLPRLEKLVGVLLHGRDFFGDLPAEADDLHRLHAVERNIPLLTRAWADPHIRREAQEQMEAKTHGAARAFAEHLFGDGDPGEVTVEDVQRALQNYRDEWDRFTAAERARWRGKSGDKGFDSNGGDGGDDFGGGWTPFTPIPEGVLLEV